MKILVTGAGGFIGGWLTSELQAHDYEVIGIDMADGDLTTPGVFSAIADDCGAEAVVHLAAQVGRAFGEDDLMHTVHSNAVMTTLIASACGQRNLPLAYASTSEVYGDQGADVCRENGPLLLPHNLYGLTKRWGEEACQLYSPRQLRLLRFSMPYGPGAPPGRGRRAMDNILWQAHHGKSIPIHRGAERSWCWAGDTARGIRIAMEAAPGIYNVGRDDDPISMIDLALMACKMVDAPCDLIDLQDAPAKQTVVKRLSTMKLRKLGWHPTVELEEGMGRVLEWVQGFDADGRRLQRKDDPCPI